MEWRVIVEVLSVCIEGGRIATGSITIHFGMSIQASVRGPVPMKRCCQ